MIEQNRCIVKRIDIQGANILALDVIRCNRVEYKIGCFKKTDIYLHDYRKVGVKAMGCFLCNQDAQQFLEMFGSPALVKIFHSESGAFLIELHDTKAKKQDFVVWAANGLTATVPMLDYTFLQAEFINTNRVAWLSVYKSESRENE